MPKLRICYTYILRQCFTERGGRQLKKTWNHLFFFIDILCVFLNSALGSVLWPNSKIVIKYSENIVFMVCTIFSRDLGRYILFDKFCIHLGNQNGFRLKSRLRFLARIFAGTHLWRILHPFRDPKLVPSKVPSKMFRLDFGRDPFGSFKWWKQLYNYKGSIQYNFASLSFAWWV